MITTGEWKAFGEKVFVVSKSDPSMPSEIQVARAMKSFLTSSTHKIAEEEYLANAKLIAAAPDLYYALRALVAAYMTGSVPDHLVDAAYAAIAKAEGR